MGVSERHWIVAGAMVALAACVTWAQDTNAADLFAQKRYAEAKDRAVSGATRGDANSMYVLGEIYAAGAGVTRDEAEAAQWFRKAADAGYAPAMNALGRAYEGGSGVEQNFAIAAVWYQRSAEKSDAQGMNRLGRLYEIGGGVPRDYAQALQWYLKSADGGCAAAMTAIGSMYENGRAPNRAQDFGEALRWYEKAAKAGDANGMYGLASSYEAGKGTAPDRKLAAEWYGKAAAAGSAQARARLGSDNSALRASAAGKAPDRSSPAVNPADDKKVADAKEAGPPQQSTQPRMFVPPTAVIAAPRIRTMVNQKDGQIYIWIPPGTSRMGCSDGDEGCGDDEKPARTERVETGFWLGRTEVTQAAFQSVMGENPSAHRGDRFPVENVTWNEALDYCTNIGGRLPTDVEWEYAARAGTTAARYGDLDAIAWNANNGAGATHPVAQKQPNAFGLYDMLGNVWEWVEDSYPGSAAERILRGGSVFMDISNTRASRRYPGPVSGRFNGRGFRCAGQWPAPEDAPRTLPPGAPTAAVQLPKAGPAGSPDSEGVYRPGNGVSRPTLLRKVEPEYSEEARKAKIAGVVVLYCVIGPDGKAINIRVIKGLGYGLDQKAIEAVKKWKFDPGRKDGKPVAVAATMEINFRLI